MTNQPVASIYTTHNEITPAKTVSAVELMNMVTTPANTPKNRTSLITPTVAPAKTKQVVIEHNQMTMCWVDIDHGNVSKDGLVAVAIEYCLHDILIYSTASAIVEDKRWRLLIFITRSMQCDEWQLLQEALARIFDGDVSAARVTQGFYAPTNPSGDYYEHHIGLGESLDPDNLPTALKAVLDEIENERAAQQQVARNAPEHRSEARTQGQGVIGLVNDAYRLEDVLSEQGFKHFFDNRWLHPDSKSGQPGVVLLTNEEGELRYYSHHSEDTDPLADKHYHDAFDLLCQYKFDGDVQAAVAYYADELDPEGQQQRQREFAVERSRASVLEEFSNILSVDDVHTAAAQVVDWPYVNGNGRPLNTLPNFKHMLDHFGVKSRYNTIRKDIEVVYPGMQSTVDNAKDTAMTQITSLAGLNGFPQNRVRDYVISTADQNPFNPIMEFILSQPWDGKSRIKDLLNTIRIELGFDQNLAALLIRKWLISAVAAVAMAVGFHSRGVLVLQGPQGCGKTSWLRQLLPECIRQYFKEGALLDPNNKDTLLTALAHWIVELGELDATFKKAEIARLKAFITQTEDKIRRPYGYCDAEYQRRTVFCASVNEPEFLVDATGNSRFWVIPVVGLDYEHSIDMQQLWGEVYHLYQAGERWWLTPDEERVLEESNANYRQADAVEEMLISRFGGVKNGTPMVEMTTTDILKKLGIREPNKSQLQTAGKVLLNELKFEQKRSRKCRLYKVPNVLDVYFTPGVASIV